MSSRSGQELNVGLLDISQHLQENSSDFECNFDENVLMSASQLTDLVGDDEAEGREMSKAPNQGQSFIIQECIVRDDGLVVPVDEKKLAPNLEEVVPEREEAAQDFEEAAPDLNFEEAALDLEEAAPGYEEDGPGIDPGLQEAAPDLQEAAPDLQEATPDLQEATPDLQEAAPDLQEAAEAQEDLNAGGVDDNTDSISEGNGWLSYSELMLDSYPARSKIIYLKSYKLFERYLRSKNQFIENVAPTELQLLNYFHHLRHEKNLAPTTLWSTYSRINACVKRMYGFSLKDFVRVSDVLKSYETGYKVKKASIFSPQEVLSIKDCLKFNLKLFRN